MSETTFLSMPVLPLRGLTIFPSMTLYFDVGRALSIKALNEAMSADRSIFLITQRELMTERPELSDLYEIGTISKVTQILRLPGDTVRVMVEGVSRGRVHDLNRAEGYLRCDVEPIPAESVRMTKRVEAIIRRNTEVFERYLELAPKLTQDVQLRIMNSRDPGYIADGIAQNATMRADEKQSILEELRPVRRLERVTQALLREIGILELEHDMQEKVRQSLGRGQKEHILREQMRVIREELGESDDVGEIDEYRDRIKKAKLPQEVEEKLLKEVSRLSKQPFGSAEGAVIRNYLDVCLELPWHKRTKERVDVAAAQKILDRDHFGLEKVKERILEFIAARQLAPELKGQILCLVGPPGVGKTSVAMSVARALGRRLCRLSLGGVRDEADIRGHRKTYVGAMPGRIMTALSQSGTSNPLMLLDEIDKLGTDFRGDPAAALLEVLDAEQNSSFRDHYLEIPFDLSDVLFVTTANTTSTIPRPLLDRMEVIELSSYTDEEKLQIAKRHLLPKQRKRHGLTASNLRLTDDAIREIIVAYTRESGVRILERQLAALCRKAAKEIVTNGVKGISVTGDNLETYLGPKKYYPERLYKTAQVGVVNGLAWTSVGGEILEVEVNVVPGTGKIELTGNLGDVMKESARAALSYLRSRARELGLPEDFHRNLDLHVHFPEGAVPKDGPSAGIAITVAMVSALTNAPVKPGVAMTGEVTLRGRVLPIGGLKEKTMAAFRYGIKTVYIPSENVSDLEEIDQTVRHALHFVSVEHVDAVLAGVLGERLAPKTSEPPISLPEQTVGGNGKQLQQ